MDSSDDFESDESVLGFSLMDEDKDYVNVQQDIKHKLDEANKPGREMEELLARWSVVKWNIFFLRVLG